MSQIIKYTLTKRLPTIRDIFIAYINDSIINEHHLTVYTIRYTDPYLNPPHFSK